VSPPATPIGGLGATRLPCGQQNIGDITRRKEHDAYGKALERLLRDLKVEAGPAAD
jgi:hypothetical protein